jgi:hypothetical protein
LTITFWCEAKILAGKWMSTLAMGFAPIYRRKRLAVFHRVYALRYNAQVFWVYATSVAANMIDHKSIRDWAAENFIRNAMCTRSSTIPDSSASSFHSRVAVLINHLGPIPTTSGGINYGIFKNTLRKCFRSPHGISIPCTQANLSHWGVD